MTSFSLAKINIGLKIIGKRDDGYHNIESIFYPINWHDVIEILPLKAGETQIETVLSSFDFPSHQNMVYKSWELLHLEYAISPIRAYIWKRIPIQAGLGGGSGNAALTLKMLREIFNLQLDDNKLCTLALQIGSDVPFFLYAKPAFVSGRGEVIEFIDLDLSPFRIQVVVPKRLGTNIGISTKEAYKLIKPKRAEFSLRDLKELPLKEWRRFIENDFETVMFSRYPLLKEIKEKMYEKKALYASMSGTGSAIFGIFPKDEKLPKWEDSFHVYEE
ncbi:MAG: 4-(cytidine 5'-diphospho)-2-C-methyl-D-erythritol kinase [Bacteroidales bacterium]|nr:4-(cytidine 5'-diphospho)-2-C-methyl-D-erythritol kinase [Bacteroidales bacterium]